MSECVLFALHAAVELLDVVVAGVLILENTECSLCVQCCGILVFLVQIASLTVLQFVLFQFCRGYITDLGAAQVIDK